MNRPKHPVAVLKRRLTHTRVKVRKRRQNVFTAYLYLLSAQLYATIIDHYAREQKVAQYGEV